MPGQRVCRCEEFLLDSRLAYEIRCFFSGGLFDTQLAHPFLPIGSGIVTGKHSEHVHMLCVLCTAGWESILTIVIRRDVSIIINTLIVLLALGT